MTNFYKGPIMAGMDKDNIVSYRIPDTKQRRKVKNLIVTEKSMNELPKLVFTRNPPDKEGYYYYCNFGEHTPTMVHVKRDYSTGELWADNGEFTFEIKKIKKQKAKKIKAEDVVQIDGEDKYCYGDELWCYIPNPFLPNGIVQVEPECY